MSNLRWHSASAYMEVRRLNNKPFSSDSGISFSPAMWPAVIVPQYARQILEREIKL